MSACAGNVTPLRFSTDEVPDRERIPTCRDEFGRRLLRVEIEPLLDAPFHIKATFRELPGLRTLTCTGSAVHLQRTGSNVADGDDSIGIIVNLSERGHISQRGRDVVLGHGDAVAVLHTEPATVVRAEGSHLGLAVPRSALAHLVRNIDDAVMQLIPRGTEALRLLVNYLSSLEREEILLATPKLRRVVATHLHNLVSLTLSPQHSPAGERGLSAVADARLNAALGYIAKNFDEPELTLVAVAISQDISPRYLQRLMEASGTSFTARVNELRLQQAFRLLTEAHDGACRISDIAFQVGFSDLSHFNRLFRSRFGDTPRGVRRQGRRAH